MKMTLNKLIANDIINYGMDQTSSFNYIVYLDSYIDDYDEESQKYILDNLDEIKSAIEQNENIADFHFDEKDKSFDMVFYWDALLDRVDRYVLSVIKEKDSEKADLIDLDEVREISQSLMDDQATKNLAIEKIKNTNIKGYEL